MAVRSALRPRASFLRSRKYRASTHAACITATAAHRTGGKSQQFFCNQMLTACHALQYRLLRIKIRYRKQDAAGAWTGIFQTN